MADVVGVMEEQI